MKEFYDMDEFELAGFDEETCEQLRKISFESGIEPCHIISAIRGYQPETHLASAWYIFKQKMWDAFTKSKIGKFIIRFADRLAALLERKEK